MCVCVCVCVYIYGLMFSINCSITYHMYLSIFEFIYILYKQDLALNNQ